MEKEQMEVSVQMLDSLQLCTTGMEPIYNTYLNEIDSPPPNLNQELNFSQRSLTVLEVRSPSLFILTFFHSFILHPSSFSISILVICVKGTILYQDLDRLELQLLEADSNAMKTRNDQFETLLQQFSDEERQLNDRVGEFNGLGEKLCVIEQNLAKYQVCFFSSSSTSSAYFFSSSFPHSSVSLSS
jgi:hypothetical protein